MQSWQVVVVGNYFFCRQQNNLWRKVAELGQPQFFRQPNRLVFIAKCCVVLIVVIGAKQRKGLIDRINQFRAGGRWFSLPSCGR